MSQEENTESVEETTENTETREYTEIEQQAMERGWSPDFQGDENKRAISAEEFLDRQKLYDDLRKRGRENKELRSELETLKANDKKFAKRIYEQAKKDLQAKKKAAYEEGDTDKVVETDEELRQLDKEQEEFDKSPQTDNSAQEAFSDWVSKNPWYQNDSDLAAYADGAGPRVLQENPHLADNNGNVINHEEFLQKVTEKTKKAFPEKFKGTTRRQAVEGDTGNTGGSTKKKYSIKSLPEEERDVAKRVIEATGMKEEDYVKQVLGE